MDSIQVAATCSGSVSALLDRLTGVVDGLVASNRTSWGSTMPVTHCGGCDGSGRGWKSSRRP